MKTKEQFKAYVYEKAEKKRILKKCSRMAFMRGFAAFSLLFIVSGALIYGGFINNNKSEAEVCGTFDNESGKGNYSFSKSIIADSANDCVLEMAVEQADDSAIKYSKNDKVISQDDALEIAKENCTINYDMTDISYDDGANIWKFVFYTQNVAGNCQTVCINQDGSVNSIVYGE